MPRILMMRRTHYSLPDYDDNAPPRNGYQLEPRDSLTDHNDLNNHNHHDHHLEHFDEHDYHKEEEIIHHHFENNLPQSSCKYIYFKGLLFHTLIFFHVHLFPPLLYFTIFILHNFSCTKM